MPDYRARPFDLKVDDEAANAALKVALFKASAGDEGRVNVSGGAETLTFEYKDASGLSARKAFTFEPSGFIVRVAVDVEAGGKALNPTVLWGLGLGDQVPGMAASSYVQVPQGIIVRGDTVQRLAPGDLDQQPVREGDVTAAGVDTQYFIVMAMPSRTLRAEYRRATMPAPAGADPKNAAHLVGFGVRQAQSMSDVKFFVGRRTSTCSRPSTAGSCASSTSGSSTSWPCRCCAR